MLKYPALQAALRAGDSMRMEFSWNWSAGCVSNDPSRIWGGNRQG